MPVSDDGSLYLQLKPGFFQYFRRWGIGESDLEDLYQAAFQAYLEACAEGRYEALKAKPSTYIHATGRYLCLKSQQYQYRQIPLDDDGPLTQALAHHPESESEDHERLDWLRHVIQEQLDPQAQSLLRQYYWEGKPLEEIAEAMNLSLGAVKMRKKRSLKKLFAHYKSAFF